MCTRRITVLFLCILLLGALLLLPATAASTMNQYEQALFDRIFNSEIIAGKRVCPVDGLQGVVFNYCIRDGVDINKEQYELILGYIDDCYALKSEPNVIEWAKRGDNDLSHLTRKQKERLLANGKAAAAVLGMTFEYNSVDNTVTIADGDVVVCHTEAIVKQTGESSPYLLILFAGVLTLVFAGTIVLVCKTKRVTC